MGAAMSHYHKAFWVFAGDDFEAYVAFYGGI
jgi:hypothetical protein